MLLAIIIIIYEALLNMETSIGLFIILFILQIITSKKYITLSATWYLSGQDGTDIAERLYCNIVLMIAPFTIATVFYTFKCVTLLYLVYTPGYVHLMCFRLTARDIGLVI